VATISTDLSATVLKGRTLSPAGAPAAAAGSFPADRHTLLTMLMFRYAGTGTAKRVYTEASSKANGSHPAIETELLLRTDPGGRRHVASPSVGAFVRSDVLGWAVLGLAVGLIAGFAGNGGLFGALEKGVVSGIVWGILGLVAGTMYGLWAGRSISARRLNSIRPILPPDPDTSMVLAWAVGAPQERAVTAWSAPGSGQVILRFESAPHGAVLDV
jgi:hypothetical protein